jgi:hypothetical protein
MRGKLACRRRDILGGVSSPRLVGDYCFLICNRDIVTFAGLVSNSFVCYLGTVSCEEPRVKCFKRSKEVTPIDAIAKVVSFQFLQVFLLG